MTLEERIEQWYIDRGIKQREAEERASKIVLKDQIAIKLPSLSEDDAETVVFLFDPWQPNVAYEVDDVVRFQKVAYKVVQAHTSQPAWTPPTVPALFTPLRNTGGGGSTPDPWVQPTGAQDAYVLGDRVTHDNPNDSGNIWVYESAIDANTQEPGRDGTFDRWWTPVEAV